KATIWIAGRSCRDKSECQMTNDERRDAKSECQMTNDERSSKSECPKGGKDQTWRTGHSLAAPPKTAAPADRSAKETHDSGRRGKIVARARLVAAHVSPSPGGEGRGEGGRFGAFCSHIPTTQPRDGSRQCGFRHPGFLRHSDFDIRRWHHGIATAGDDRERQHDEPHR